MNFLYFVPTALKSLKPDKLSGFGLAYAADPAGCAMGNRDCPKGPGGARGLIVSFPRKGQPASASLYKPADQVWKASPCGKHWVGLNKSERPGPDDLRRGNLIAGEAVKLRDGRAWSVPVARSPVGGATLPRDLVLGEDGRTWVQEDLAEFFTLSAHAATLFPLFYGSPTDDADKDGEDPEGDSSAEDGGGLPWETCIGIAVDALAVNYRVGPVEVSMLRLLSTDVVRGVLHALVDLPNFRRVMDARSKNDPASGTSPTGDGSEATSPDTSPLSAT